AVRAPVMGLLMVPFIVPMLAVSVRRMHDTGRSGAMMLIALIPLAGPIIYLYLMASSGESGSNRYGPPLPCSLGAVQAPQ
ncbi:MAG: DUF805 domain-containing protein, partial [Gordonia sp.]|nr:DUF805 domain-containing protein [Gordonia sp. (in: high G+C Gram-positive bacteria)]